MPAQTCTVCSIAHGLVSARQRTSGGGVWFRGRHPVVADTVALVRDSGSGIVPTLAPGTHVTTRKNDVNYVVTEYGVAQLRGKSAKERAQALIAIAHPDFRGELRAAASKMGVF